MANSSGQGGSANGFSVEYAHSFNATGATVWTPGAAPVGQTITGVALSVITADANNKIIDSDGTVITGMPSGYSAAWGTLGGGSLTSVQLIDAGATGRIIVTFQTK